MKTTDSRDPMLYWELFIRQRGSATQASLDAGGGVVFGYGNGGYQLGIFDTGQLFLSQVGGPTQPALSPAQVVNTAWHHVAVTKNGTVVVFYVDGVGFPAGAFNATFGFDSPATIGTLATTGRANLHVAVYLRDLEALHHLITRDLPDLGVSNVVDTVLVGRAVKRPGS